MGLLEDLVQAGRALRRRPGFLALAVLTLTLGIGANTALFSVLHAVVLRPLSYADPSSLFVFRTLSASGARSGVSLPDFEDAMALPGVFDSGGLASYWTFNLTGRAVPERILGARVTGGLFRTLGVTPLLGRGIVPDDDRPGAAPVVVLAESLWKSAFAADPALLGRPLMLNGVAHTVVGVMPRSFTYPGEDVLLWGAIADNMGGMPRDARFLEAVARIGSGVAPRQAGEALLVLSNRLKAAHPATNATSVLRLEPLQDAVVGEVRRPLSLLSAAAGLLLLLACVNVGHLLLAQGLARRRETAVRIALGASPWRLLRLQAAENLLLALAGAGAGVGLASLCVRLVRAHPPAGLPRAEAVGLDATVITFALVAAFGCALVLALLRALDGLRRDPTLALAGRSGPLGAPRQRLRGGLVAAEVALATLLLVGAGLLLRSFDALQAVDPGLDLSRGVSAQVFLGPPRYRSLAAHRTYVRQALERIRALPGFESVAAVSSLPLADDGSRVGLRVEGREDAGEPPRVNLRVVSPGYLATLGVPLLAGRALAESDAEDAPRVLLANAAAVRALFGGRSPMGRRVRFENSGDDAWQTIVGVVGDVRSRALAEEDGPALYGTFMQRRVPWLRWTSFVARSARPAHEALVDLRGALLAVDPDQPVYALRSFDELRAASLAPRRLQTTLAAAFAGLALLLAGIGSYGVLSQTLRQRVPEIGVRLALGASGADVARLVARGALGPALLGLALGLPAAALASRLLRSQLFGVGPGDPWSYALAACALLFAVALAGLRPARMALRVDPAVALRNEG